MLYVYSISVSYVYLVPTPDHVNVTAISAQTVGQPLILECYITTVRGITSGMDIVWSNNGSELKRTDGANVTSTSDNLQTYKDYFTAFQLNTSDNGKVYQCEVIVNTNPTLTADGTVTLDLTG